MIVGGCRLDLYCVVRITVITSQLGPAPQLSSVRLWVNVMAGDASLLCVPPADKLTAGDHHGTVEVDPLVLDGGVLGTKAAGGILSVLAVNLSLDQGVVDFVIKPYFKVFRLVDLIQT